MARPVMFWAKTDTALLVLTLVIVAERIASSFSRKVIKPASRKHAPRRFYAHHRGTGSGILDGNAALEAGFGPVIDVTLAGEQHQLLANYKSESQTAKALGHTERTLRKWR